MSNALIDQDARSIAVCYFGKYRYFENNKFELYAIADANDGFIGLKDVNETQINKIKREAKRKYKFVRKVKNQYDCFAIYVREPKS